MWARELISSLYRRVIIGGMVKISDDEIRHLAELSGLKLDMAEAAGLKKDIEKILGYVNQLNELDTSGVEPVCQINDIENVCRIDEVIDYGVSGEELVELSADTEDGQIKVPKVL